MEQATTHSETVIRGSKAVSRRNLLTLAGLGALVPGAALLTKAMGRFTPPPAARVVDATPPLAVIHAFPRLAGATLTGERGFARADATPAAYLYFDVGESTSWPSVLSFYERALSAQGWAVRRNPGKRGGLGFSRGAYSGFVAQRSPVSFYVFLAALS